MRLATLRAKHAALAPVFTERSRRLWAATEARALGHGGIDVVERATGISRATIERGVRELEAHRALPEGRSRRPGGGRKAATALDATLLRDLDALVEPTAAGNPDSPLRWSCKSTRTLAVALQALGHAVSHTAVATLLHRLGYSLQGNVKTREGRQHPDRDAQFRYIAEAVTAGAAPPATERSRWTPRKRSWSAISRMAAGAGGAPASPTTSACTTSSFARPATGRPSPMASTTCTATKAGSVSASTTTPPASPSMRFAAGGGSWGAGAYPRARSLVITADAGGSNGPRVRLWKWELQRLANRTGLAITVCHFPPGTSKWNKIEHRLFSHIAMNWRGTPLVSLATIVSLIASTQSRAGLRVRSEIDRRRYPDGVTVTDAQMATVRLTRHAFHGDWNYTIYPARSVIVNQLFPDRP